MPVTKTISRVGAGGSTVGGTCSSKLLLTGRPSALRAPARVPPSGRARSRSCPRGVGGHRLRDQFLRVGEAGARVALAAEHARHLRDARLARERRDLAGGLAARLA